MYNLCLMDEFRVVSTGGGRNVTAGSRSDGVLEFRRRIKSENGVGDIRFAGVMPLNGMESAVSDAVTFLRNRRYSAHHTSVSSSTTSLTDGDRRGEDAEDYADVAVMNVELAPSGIRDDNARSTGPSTGSRPIGGGAAEDGQFTEPFHPTDVLTESSLTSPRVNNLPGYLKC